MIALPTHRARGVSVRSKTTFQYLVKFALKVKFWLLLIHDLVYDLLPGIKLLPLHFQHNTQEIRYSEW